MAWEKQIKAIEAIKNSDQFLIPPKFNPAMTTKE